MDPEPAVYAWYQCLYRGQFNLVFYASNLQLLDLGGAGGREGVSLGQSLPAVLT